MKSILSFIALLTILSTSADGNSLPTDSDSTNHFKHEFSIETSLTSSIPITKRLPRPLIQECDCFAGGWMYTVFPERGFQVGAFYDYKLTPLVTLRSGLAVSRTKSKLTGDTAILNTVDPVWFIVGFDPEVVLIEHANTNLFIPLAIGFQLGKISIFGTTETRVIYSSVSEKTNIYNQTRRNHRSSFDGSFSDVVTELDFSWNVAGYYLIENKLIDFDVFASIASEFRLDNWALSFGVRVPMLRMGEHVGN